MTGPAKSIAEVTLVGASPRPALGLADHGIAARSNAPLRPVAQPETTNRAVALTTIAATPALSIYQLHHTVMFAGGLAC